MPDGGARVCHLARFAIQPRGLECTWPPREAAGSDATAGCEPGQVRKEAALSITGRVPSSSRSLFCGGFFMRVALEQVWDLLAG